MRKWPQRLEQGGRRNLRERLTTSFWLVPSAMTLGAVLLSILTLKLDGDEGVPFAAHFWDGRADGARQLLAALAGSMITLAGIVFSVTIVVLTLAAAQFGPRLLRNFMHDRGNQVVPGTFVATFVYCVVVLGSIRGPQEGAFIPHLSINVGLLLGMISIGVFIYFLHHIAVSIQAERLVASIGRQLIAVIHELFPEEIGKSNENPPSATLPQLPPRFADEAVCVGAVRDGYIQAIEGGMLMMLAETEDAVIRLLYRPGDFVTKNSCVMLVWKEKAGVSPRLQKKLAKTIILGEERTPTQDPEYAAHQMIEIALRALSPALNDPFTTIICIDWLGAGLSQMGVRDIPSPGRYGACGKLRVIAPTTSFADLADVAFNQIRQYGHQSVPVTLRMLETMAQVSEKVRRVEDRETLRYHATLVREDALTRVPNERDRERINELYRRAMLIMEPGNTRMSDTIVLPGGEGSDKA